MQPVTGEGSVGLTTEPSGAFTSSARSAPSLNRMSLPSDMKSEMNTDEAVFGNVLFT